MSRLEEIEQRCAKVSLDYDGVSEVPDLGRTIWDLVEDDIPYLLARVRELEALAGIL